MSKEIGVLKNTGSRNVDITIHRYFGGKGKGLCVQLTAVDEEGNLGYIQLSRSDFRTLQYILSQYVFEEEMHLIDFTESEVQNDN